jgi:hypothetical protein
VLRVSCQQGLLIFQCYIDEHGIFCVNLDSFFRFSVRARTLELLPVEYKHPEKVAAEQASVTAEEWK